MAFMRHRSHTGCRPERGWDSVPVGDIHLHFSFSLEHVISPEYGSSGGTMRQERERGTKVRYLKQRIDLGIERERETKNKE
jgi:hypothetical protein